MSLPERLGRVETVHPGDAGHPPLRPRDAATLILIDRSAAGPGLPGRVLLGKRSSKHAFMPDTYVFPGGRRDRLDHTLPFATDLHPDVLNKLSAGKTGRGARALALAAARELEEETGLVLGERQSGRLHAHLHSLRYVARAVTPPGGVRRFDTRFFLTFADEAGIAPELARDTAELHDLRWHDLADLDGLTMPWITRQVLQDIINSIGDDPALPFGRSVPFYYSRRGQFFRSSL